MDYLKTLQDQLHAMARGAIQTTPALLIAILVVLATWILARLATGIADRMTGHTHMREALKQLVETLVRLAIWTLGILVAGTIVIPGLTPASLFAGLGIGAVAIGFAFQDIFQNFLAGVLIMVRDKMRIGDVIECQGIAGRVERISLRETHIRQLSNELTIVPNTLLFKNPVKVLTDQHVRRDEIVVGVGYDADLDVAAATLRKAVQTVEHVHPDHPIDVFARQFAASSIDFTVRYWSASKPVDVFQTRSDVIMAIKRALDGAGIEIPYPYVTNTFKPPVPPAPADNGPK